MVIHQVTLPLTEKQAQELIPQVGDIVLIQLGTFPVGEWLIDRVVIFDHIDYAQVTMTLVGRPDSKEGERPDG